MRKIIYIWWGRNCSSILNYNMSGTSEIRQMARVTQSSRLTIFLQLRSWFALEHSVIAVETIFKANKSVFETERPFRLYFMLRWYLTVPNTLSNPVKYVSLLCNHLKKSLILRFHSLYVILTYFCKKLITNNQHCLFIKCKTLLTNWAL